MILFNSLTMKIVVVNTATEVKFYNKNLVETYSKLRGESVYKIWNNMSISTNYVALATRLEVIM